MDTLERTRRKILTLPELTAARQIARAEGRPVVQCHGCFDIVHPGHVRHLQHAARQGEVLLVTLSADAGVGKGPGRPLIPQDLRAENLAALDCVDWVCVNPFPTAAELLERTRPDVYVKGREYETNNDPRFAAERAAVERHGGRTVFSSGDVIFSSTALVAALERSHDPAHARFRSIIEAGALTPAAVAAAIDGFSSARVCVVGETIIDTYVFCDRPEVAGESPVIALRPLEQRSHDGGAAVIARHIAALGGRPVLVTALPRTPQAEALRARLHAEGVEVRAVECEGPILEKQRFLVGAQKVMKLDLVRPITLDAASRDRFTDLALSAADGLDAAVVADFGNGLLTAGALSRLMPGLRAGVGFLAGDVSGRRSSLLHFKGADLLTPTESELRDAVQDHEDSVNAAVWKLIERTGARRVFVTMGPEGLTAFERLEESRRRPDTGWSTRLRAEHVPAIAPHAIDPLGCGDALLAAATLVLCGRRPAADPLALAALLSAVAAGVEAARLGNEPVAAADLRAAAGRIIDARLAVAPAHAAPRLAV